MAKRSSCIAAKQRFCPLCYNVIKLKPSTRLIEYNAYDCTKPFEIKRAAIEIRFNYYCLRQKSIAQHGTRVDQNTVFR